MKIIQLNIYGYGQFHHTEIMLDSPSFQVIYGENEAGKSTIMSFIQCILFGFPQKVQQEKRYEPKHVNAYGGSLVAETVQHGRVKIERLPGKAGSGVTVYFENGETGGADVLQQLVSYFDKTVYQSIYSFDIHGIQQVSKVGAEDLGKFLLSSGLLGTDAVLQTELSLSKKQEQLFKPNGKKPEINAALAALKDIHTEVMKAKQQLEPYNDFINEKEAAEQSLREITEKKRELEAEAKRMGEIVEALPLFHEEAALKNELDKAQSHFPSNGQKRMEELEGRESPLRSEYMALKTIIREQTEAIEQVPADERILEHKEEIERLRGEYSAWEMKRAQYGQTRAKQEQAESRIHEEKKRLFSHEIDSSIILDLNTGAAVREEIREIVGKHQHLQQKKHLLDQQFERVKENLEESESRLSDYAEGMLEEEERRQLEERVRNLEEVQRANLDKNKLREEHREVQTEIKKQKDAVKKKNSRLKGLGVFFALIILLCTGWLFAEGLWLIGAALLSLGMAGFFILMKSRTTDTSFIEHLQNKEKVLKKQLDAADHTSENTADMETAKGMLWKDEQIRRSYELEEVVFKQCERAYDRTVSSFDEWEKEYYTADQQARRVFETLKMDSSFSPLVLPDLLQAAVNLQNDILAFRQAEKKAAELSAELTAYEKKIASLAQSFDIGGTACSSLLDGLFKALKDSEENKRLRETAAAKRAEAEDKLKKIEAELSLLDEKKKELLSLADADDTEEFWEKGKQAEHLAAVKQKASWIQQQLKTKQHLLAHEPLDFSKDYPAEKARCEQELIAAADTENQLKKKLAELTVHIKNMEESGLYSDLKQKAALQKEEVKQLARQWAVLAAARHMLNQTVEYSRSVRLPSLLQQAESFFSRLTNERYVRVFLPENEQTMTVERKDGTRFAAHELSQATAEQLYIAIRLALACHISTSEAMPLLIDDGFVNFDRERTGRVMELLRELSEHHQILFFTCQEHLLKLFHESDILDLEKKKRAAGLSPHS
ncbi:AAA family ATPase [Bacillus sp. FSL H8-0547]